MPRLVFLSPPVWLRNKRERGSGGTCGADFSKNASDRTVLLKLDFKNAFNSIRRDVIAEKLADKMPELTPFFNLCYGNASFLSLVFLSSTLQKEHSRVTL